MGSKLKVADNSGAQTIRCIQVKGGHYRRYGQIGDIVVASVQTAKPRKSVKKKEVVRAIIVRQRRNFRRKNGSYVKFDDNAVVLLNAGGEMRGTRIFGPVARELREKQFMKIVSLAPEVL